MVASDPVSVHQTTKSHSRLEDQATGRSTESRYAAKLPNIEIPHQGAAQPARERTEQNPIGLEPLRVCYLERTIGWTTKSKGLLRRPVPTCTCQSVQSQDQASRGCRLDIRNPCLDDSPISNCPTGDHRHLLDSSAQEESHLFRSRLTAIEFFQHHIGVPSSSTFQLDGTRARRDVIDHQRFPLQIDQTHLLRTVGKTLRQSYQFTGRLGRCGRSGRESPRLKVSALTPSIEIR